MTPIEGNEYIEAFEHLDEKLNSEEIMMINIMHLIDTDGYRYDFLLASMAMMTWLKTIFQFRVTQQFGPMFKIMI